MSTEHNLSSSTELGRERYLQLYRSWNFNLIPQKVGSKESVLPWKRYQTERSSWEEWDKWFLREDHNIACVLGSISSNHCVVDFDSKESFDKFANGRSLPKTWITETSRGVHIHVRTDRPIRSFSIPKLKVEILGEGHLVTLPPSVHETGKQYRTLQFAPLMEITADDLESLIVAYARKEGVNRVRSFKLRAILQGVPEGERHKSALSYANYLLKTARLEPNTAFYELQRWNDLCRPPLPNTELEQIFQDTQNYSKKASPSKATSWGGLQ